MNWSDYVALGLSVIAAAFSVWSFFLERKRNMREATIHSFDELEEKVFNTEKVSLHKISDDTFKQIVFKLKEDENDVRSKQDLEEITGKVALLEHFAVGVNYKTYDVTVVNAMAGNMLIKLYDSIKPIIDYKRAKPSGQNNYRELEKMIEKIRKLRKRRRHALHSQAF